VWPSAWIAFSTVDNKGNALIPARELYLGSARDRTVVGDKMRLFPLFPVPSSCSLDLEIDPDSVRIRRTD
jgi:hypothetical protein